MPDLTSAPRESRRAAVVAACLLILAARAAAGDWLVTRDGARLETKGPWVVKGSLITFTAHPGGSLSSLRATEVDLQASAEATRSARLPAPAPATAKAPSARKKPVMVLTDADVGHVDEEQLRAEVAATSNASTAAASAAAKPSPPLVVTDWNRAYSQEEEGVTVTGVVRNTGKAMEGNIQVSVRVFDDQGALVGVADATLSTGTLMPGKSAEFKAVFPGIHLVAAATFDVVSGNSLQIREGSNEDAGEPPAL